MGRSRTVMLRLSRNGRQDLEVVMVMVRMIHFNVATCRSMCDFYVRNHRQLLSKALFVVGFMTHH